MALASEQVLWARQAGAKQLQNQTADKAGARGLPQQPAAPAKVTIEGPVTVVNQPDPNQQQRDAEERAQTRFTNRLQVWTLVFAALAALGALGAYFASRRSASAALQQVALMRQQLVGTMEAVLQCAINQADVGVSVALRNVGQVDARDVDGTVQIMPVQLPDLTPLAAPVVHRFSYPAAVHEGGVGQLYRFPPEWLPPREWSLWTNTNTVLVDVTFSWDNGFGDKLHGQYGQVYLPHWEYRYKGGSRSSQSAQFHDRSGIADMWRDISQQLTTGLNTQDPEYQKKQGQPKDQP